MFMVASAPLGMETSVRASVRMRVERRLMSSTVPDAVAETAVVADADDFIGQNGNSAKKIFECLLCGECDGNAANAESGEHGGQVEAQDADRGQDGDDHHQRCQQPLAQYHQGSGADAARADGMDAQALHREAGGAQQKPEETDADDNPDGPGVIKTWQQRQAEVAPITR